MKKIILSLIFILLGHNFALAASPDYDKEVCLPKSVFNFHVVDPSVMRGSQPSEAGIFSLREDCGVKAILNLRNDESVQWEKQLAEKLGIKFFNIPMNGSQEQSIEKIEQCLSIIQDKSNQPVFVHCMGGKDRTGMVVAAYRMKYNQWLFSDALFEMYVYGYSRACCFNLERSLSKWNKWRQEGEK